MCNCGRKQPTEVVTSAQASAEDLARQAQNTAEQAEIMTASAGNALANATSGWVLAPAE